jgi:hypothetical protein
MRVKVYNIIILYFTLNKLPPSPHTENLHVPYTVLAIIITISLYTLIAACRYERVFFQIRIMICADCVAYNGKRKKILFLNKPERQLQQH